MRHANHDLVDILRRGALQQLFHDGQSGLTAFESETLLPYEA